MPDLLMPWLLALVMLNLAFVQITGTVDSAWLTGLWLATATAPLLARWRRSLWYRITWNVAVICAFTFLLQHALTTGLLHMLEDGLLLAALCQVHLMNNIGPRQKPDLLFFNSFLIAFVTSFFSRDLAWSVCFLAYAMVLVPALQLYVTLGHLPTPPRGSTRALLTDSAKRTAVAVATTALVFLLWPRDFRHQGWLDETLRMATQDYVSFSEEIRLDHHTTPTLDDAPVLRIKPSDGQATSVPSHWRGVTFVQSDGNTWRAFDVGAYGNRLATDVAWQAVSRNEWRRPGEPREPELAVRVLDTSGGRLFLPQQATTVALRNGTPVLIDPRSDGVLTFADPSHLPSEVRATVRLGSFAPPFRPKPSSPQLSALRQLPEPLPPTLLTLALHLKKQMAASASDRDKADLCRDWLEQHRQYALPGTPGAAGNLGEFLLGSGGHCEYFAAALALLLRLNDIPCRVVGGYLAHEWDESTGEMVVRQRDAHAWVEMLSADGTWITLDATPPVGLTPPLGERSWWSALVDAASDAWRSVTSFDEHGRRKLFSLALEAAHSLLTHPWILSAIAVVGALVWRRRRAAIPAPVRELQAAMRSAGVRPHPGETPREMLARSAKLPLQEPRRARLVAAVQKHEAHRYRAEAP